MKVAQIQSETVQKSGLDKKTDKTDLQFELAENTDFALCDDNCKICPELFKIEPGEYIRGIDTFVRDKRSPHPDELIPEEVDYSLLPEDTNPETIEPDRIIDCADLPLIKPKSTSPVKLEYTQDTILNDTELVMNVDKNNSEPTSTPARGSNDPPPDLTSGPNVDHSVSGR